MIVDTQGVSPMYMGRGKPVAAAVDNDSIHVDRNIAKELGLSISSLQKEGFGRSHISVAKLKERLMMYKTQELHYHPLVFAKAVTKAYEAFSLNPLSRIGVREVPFKANRSAGYGYVGNKGAQGNYEKAIKLADGLLGSKKVCRVPCMAYARGHFGTTDKPKTRLVWGFPFHQTLIEGMYAEPLLRGYLSSNTHPMVFGHTSSYVAAKMNEAKLNGFVQMTDFSGFDSSIQPMLIRIAFDILFSNFIDVNPSHRELIEKYFICTPIMFSDGERYQKAVGVPSGSYFTQMVDSIVSYIVAQYSSLMAGCKPALVLVLGDDSLVSTRFPLSTKAYRDAALELGITVSDEKSIYNSAKEIHFLGHWLSDSGVLVRPFSESLQRLIFTENHNDFNFSESIERCMGHYVDSGDFGALALAYRLYLRAISRGRFSEVEGRNWNVRFTGYQSALGVQSEQLFSFEPSLLVDH